MIAIIIALCIGSAFGHTINATVHHMFNVMDIDGDGFITKLEMTQDFDRYDADHNGKVSRHEYTVFFCQYTPEMYNYSHYLYDMYDLNHDHTLELQDYMNFFDQMDVDGDGMASFTEWAERSRIAWHNAQAGIHDSVHEHGHGCH